MIIRTLTNKPRDSKEAFYFLLCEVNKRIQADARHIQPTYGFFKAFSGPRTPIQGKRYLSVYILCINANFTRNFPLMATLKTTAVTQSPAECVLETRVKWI